MTDFFEMLGEMQQAQQLDEIANAARLQRRQLNEQAGQPQCPHCGGRFPGKFAVCSHCTREVFWGYSRPHKTKEAAVADTRSAKDAYERRETAQAAAAQKRLDEESAKYAVGSVLGVFGLLMISSLGGMVYAMVTQDGNLGVWSFHFLTAGLVMGMGLADVRWGWALCIVNPLCLVAWAAFLIWLDWDPAKIWWAFGPVCAVTIALFWIEVIISASKKQ